MLLDVTIRAYETTDKDDVIQLIRLNTPKFFVPKEEQELATFLEKERELYYVLLCQEKIVGCGGINFENNQTVGIISWDIFHPDYQGKNLGTQLMKHRMDLLNSIAHIEKVIVRTSQLTHQFYEKQGFKLIEVKKDFWADGFDLYKMEFKK